MIAQIIINSHYIADYNDIVGYIELDSADIDRNNNLTFIGLQKVRCIVDVPDDVLKIHPDTYTINILDDTQIFKASRYIHKLA